MVSGVGPAETLHRFGIDVVSALPGVGQNMWDHVFFGPSYPVHLPTLNGLANDAAAGAAAKREYQERQAGPLTSNVIEFLGWEKLPAAYRDHFSPRTRRALDWFPGDWPEVEFLGADGYVGDFSSLTNHAPRDGRNYSSILGALVAPMSRGNVTIRSASALDSPVISPNWLEHESDQQVAVAWYRRMRDVFGSRPIQSILEGAEAYPGSRVHTYRELLDEVGRSVMTVWHAACTCKMGKRDDATAVVDHRARAYGVSGMHVDASAMPLLPPGHPQSTIYALAKIADIIRKGGPGRP